MPEEKKRKIKRVSEQEIASLVKLSFMLTADHHTMAISLLTNKYKTWHCYPNLILLNPVTLLLDE